jgi:uncharacterized caspase-like protein
MRERFSRLVMLALACLICSGPSFAEDKRVALVIGNSGYKNTPQLGNPKNDASDIAAALRKLNFTVVEGLDLDKAGMERKVRDFAAALRDARTGLFFYAGHGLQVGGQNYLVPVDAELTAASAIDFEMLRLDLIQRTMEREAGTNILIIDACRDNPLARNLARALGTRSAQIGRGLSPVESGEGTLIAFSTQPGNVALDGDGRNSPYAGALLKHIDAAGDDLPTILINVRNDVMQATNRRQVPWEHSAMTAKFYFTPPRSTAQQIELEFWSSVKDSTNPAVLATYIARYPEGEFASVARALIGHYEQRFKADLAVREEDRRRMEEETKEAEVKRLEKERQQRETAITEERKRAEEAKSAAEIKRLEEQAKADWMARTDDLRKALDEARLAREAAKAAEAQKLAALADAEEATREAEKAIVKKKEAIGDPSKVVALPKVAPLPSPSDAKSAFDGRWQVTRVGADCRGGSSRTFVILIEKGELAAGGGRVTASGALKMTRSSQTSGRPMRFTGTLKEKTGEGTFYTEGGRCQGTFTAVRQ